MVEILESSLVISSEPTPTDLIWHSNIDLLVARAHTPAVYFYRPNGDPNFFVVDPLKLVLGKVLVRFYPLAGRLGPSHTSRVQIRCKAEGVLFVVGRSEMRVDDFGDFEQSDEMRRLLVPSVESGDPPLVMFYDITTSVETSVTSVAWTRVGLLQYGYDEPSRHGYGTNFGVSVFPSQ